MTKDKREKLSKIYTLAFALMTVVVGALFIVQTWAIYRSAPSGAYTRKNIAKHFNEIAPAVWVWIVALVGNIALQIAFPEKETRPKVYKDLALSLRRMEKGLPTDGISRAEITKTQEREEKNRAAYLAIAFGIIIVALSVAFATLMDVFYLRLFKAEFFTSHNGAVNRLIFGFILSLLALGVVSVCVEAIERSRKRQQNRYVEIIKQAKAENRPSKPLQSSEKRECKCRAAFSAFWEKHQKKILLSTRITLAAVGVLLVAIGIFGGGMKDVLLKAVNICTQCIGLG